jgi:aerobic-type carbon monoxide dehydrogenase small subunit (CoxS/CutS family)
MPVKAAVGKDITTIEGLSEDNSHPVQVAWIKEQVPQNTLKAGHKTKMAREW